MNKLCSFLYSLARGLRDVNAVSRSVQQGSLEPIAARIGRRVAGRLASRIINGLFR